MEPSAVPDVVDELRRVLIALIEEAQQRDPSISIVPADAEGWRAYVPVDGQSPVHLPPTPWGRVHLISVAGAGPLVVVAFGWLPEGRLFAHVTDVSTWDMPETAALEIELRLTRMLSSAEFPDLPKSMTVGDITLVTGG